MLPRSRNRRTLRSGKGASHNGLCTVPPPRGRGRVPSQSQSRPRAPGAGQGAGPQRLMGRVSASRDRSCGDAGTRRVHCDRVALTPQNCARGEGQMGKFYVYFTTIKRFWEKHTKNRSQSSPRHLQF